jgi:hypothetical protein
MLVEHFAHVPVLLLDDHFDSGAVPRSRVPGELLEHSFLVRECRRPEVADDEANGSLFGAALQNVG